LALELDLLARLADDLDERTLTFAKNHIRAAWPFEIDTPEKRLAQKLDRLLLDLPADYHDRYLDRVAATTLDDARAAVRTRIDPHHLWIAAVGDAALRESLEAAIPDLAETVVVPYDAD
jgi:predicted Zn-dependent peptidase